MNYNYQYDTNGQVIARVKTAKVIEVDNCINTKDRLDIVGHIYDKSKKEFFIAKRDADNHLVMKDGKPERDDTRKARLVKLIQR